MSTTRGKQKIKIEIKCKKITEAKNRNKLTSVEMSTRVHHESTGAALCVVLMDMSLIQRTERKRMKAEH